jgi:serine/threonine protein kinase
MEPLYLAMEYIPSGTLQDLIHSERYEFLRTDERCLPLETQLVALTGLFAALEYLANR